MFERWRHTAKVREKQLDVLLVVIGEFQDQKKEEISFPELLESLEHLNDLLPLKYSFPAPCSYPAELHDHLMLLEYNGFIRRFRIQHNGFLPKTYVSLTALGRGRANKVRAELLEGEGKLDVIAKQVEFVIGRSEDWWRLWGRKERAT